MRRKDRKAKEENGEIMLEAVIIFVPVLILLLVLLSLSFMFYQEALLNSVANEISADIAAKYKYSALAVNDNNLELEDVTGTKMFRFTFGMGSLENAHQEKASGYVNWRIPLTSLSFDSDQINVDLEITGSGIGRAYVKVTVSQKTEFFLSGILDMEGITDESTLFKATSYSECSDLMGYTSMINFTGYASGKLSAFDGVGNFYDSVKKIVNKLIN